MLSQVINNRNPRRSERNGIEVDLRGAEQSAVATDKGMERQEPQLELLHAGRGEFQTGVHLRLRRR